MCELTLTSILVFLISIDIDNSFSRTFLNVKNGIFSFRKFIVHHRWGFTPMRLSWFCGCNYWFYAITTIPQYGIKNYSEMTLIRRWRSVTSQ